MLVFSYNSELQAQKLTWAGCASRNWDPRVLQNPKANMQPGLSRGLWLAAGGPRSPQHLLAPSHLGFSLMSLLSSFLANYLICYTSTWWAEDGFPFHSGSNGWASWRKPTNPLSQPFSQTFSLPLPFLHPLLYPHSKFLGGKYDWPKLSAHLMDQSVVARQTDSCSRNSYHSSPHLTITNYYHQFRRTGLLIQ